MSSNQLIINRQRVANGCAIVPHEDGQLLNSCNSLIAPVQDPVSTPSKLNLDGIHGRSVIDSHLRSSFFIMQRQRKSELYRFGKHDVGLNGLALTGAAQVDVVTIAGEDVDELRRGV